MQYGLFVHQWLSKCKRTMKEELSTKALNSLIDDIAQAKITSSAGDLAESESD